MCRADTAGLSPRHRPGARPADPGFGDSSVEPAVPISESMAAPCLLPLSALALVCSLASSGAC